MVAAFALIALHVRSMTLTGSTQHPRLNVPFTVTLAIAVRENVSSLPNVYLPDFFGPEELGDERTISHGPAGTVYRETLTLEAHSSGSLTIGEGRMDAIDARDGKPKRFFSNGLRLYVQGPASGAAAALRKLTLWVFYALGALVALGIVLYALAGRRSREPAIDTLPPAEDVPKPEPEHSDTDTALRTLRARRDRAAVLNLREMLWSIAGARQGATLDDVLRTCGRNGERRDLLILTERAAFIDESRLQQAIDDVLAWYDRGVFA